MLKPIYFENYDELITFVTTKLTKENWSCLPEELQPKADDEYHKLFLISTEGDTYFLPDLFNLEPEQVSDIFFKIRSSNKEEVISAGELIKIKKEKRHFDYLNKLPFCFGIAGELSGIQSEYPAAERQFETHCEDLKTELGKAKKQFETLLPA